MKPPFANTAVYMYICKSVWPWPLFVLIYGKNNICNNTQRIVKFNVKFGATQTLLVKYLYGKKYESRVI